MKSGYVIGIDQSTQGTKAIVFDADGRILERHDESHAQIVSEQGWVSHDAEEIYRNVIKACAEAIKKSGINPRQVRCIGISNQRETTLAWSRTTGRPCAPAIVWQCNRAEGLCREIAENCDPDADIYYKTGIRLTPYYPASKMAWLLRNSEAVRREAAAGTLCLGTVDSWLVYRLTRGKNFCIDYSNASRTQLLNLDTLTWDPDVCGIFGIPVGTLPEIKDSDADFGMTDLEGVLEHPVPITGVMGDSHAALFGHNCRREGQIKATYGTGSSVMLNTGTKPKRSIHGLTTSLAWSIGGSVNYVLEGNINYTGAIFSWMKDQIGLIDSIGEIERLAREAAADDATCLIPAFSGLGAPWWADGAKACIVGMTRRTGKAELVRAGCESIAYQINDVIAAMRKDTGLEIPELSVDGGPTRNAFLMQYQSDISKATVHIPDTEELSAIGAAYLAGMSAGVYDESVYEAVGYHSYTCGMPEEVRSGKLAQWEHAVRGIVGL